MTATSLRVSAARFVVAGGLASAVNWAVRFPLSLLMPFQVAVATAYVVGMGVGFVLYSRWVFPGSFLRLRSQVTRFIVVNVVGLATVVLASWMLVMALARVGVPGAACEGAAHLGGIGVGAAVNFFGHRHITFS